MPDAWESVPVAISKMNADGTSILDRLPASMQQNATVILSPQSFGQVDDLHTHHILFRGSGWKAANQALLSRMMIGTIPCIIKRVG
jgi:hypothetical protein